MERVALKMDNQDGDYMFAKKLQNQFDKELLEISSDEDDVCVVNAVQRDHELAVKLQSKYEAEAVELLSDSDDDVILQASTETGSRANIDCKLNISAIKIENGRSCITEPKLFRAETNDLNSEEYFIEELQTYVDPEYNFEWKFIDVLPDIRAIFEKFDELFFQSRFKNKKIIVSWSESMGNMCTNKNYNDDEGMYTIALNAPLLRLRPRIQIISIILHEMIHAYLKMERIQKPNNGHGENFRKIMIHLNTMLHTNISFNHKLNDTSLLCRTQWYRCTGICHNYKPFHGIVRSIDGPPGLHNEWWKEHADSCGGTYYKIYEMGKKIGEDISTRYAVNVKYMLPKRENIRGRYKTTLPPKESIDLTSDMPKIISTASSEIISVETDDLNGTCTSTLAADKFIASFSKAIPFTRDACEMQCPICQERVKRKLFSNHIDGCKGFVRHVSWKKSANGNIVQNGLLELKAKPGLHFATTSRARAYSDSSHPSKSSASSSFDSYQQAKRKRFG
uniref:Protein with SprT-like domain at the N terminus n=1 Tax=Anopheles atroparvus TaxID=41427 RepID=A0AAG5D2G8_ANOAO